MKRKMEEQKREMLKEMSQADVDDMLRRHKEEIERMNDAFRKEQKRQLDAMRARMKEKNQAFEADRVKKQIQLAEIHRKK